MDELDFLEDADKRARRYIEGIQSRPVFPGSKSIGDLKHFDEPFPDLGKSADETYAMPEY